MDKARLKSFLEGMYYVYARRELIYPDPLYFLYNYKDLRDREVVGLITSSLAYGRVRQIMKSSENVLSCLGSKPSEKLMKPIFSDLVPSSFKHRFTTSGDINAYLQGINRIMREYGSIQNFLLESAKIYGLNFLSLCSHLSENLTRYQSPKSFPLMPSPKSGSACKRLFMYMRWFIRKDNVDPGGWNMFSPSQLIMPLDTHIHSLSLLLGLTSRKSADLQTAQEITAALSTIIPLDPVKYDFALSRLGIRHNLTHKNLLP